jgi:phenylacetic acid degradation operon negative regulatory protein
MPSGLESRTLLDAPSLPGAPSAKALVMTFWGDMLLPFGGRIWLGSLVNAMEQLGLDERSVRTSVHRLISEGWLSATTLGRRRELSMPPARLAELRAVQRRMYRRTPLEWDGVWHIVVMQPATPARREALRRELHWQGYAALAPNTMVHPRQPWEELLERLEARGLHDEIGHAFAARHLSGVSPPAELWPLDRLAASWTQLAEGAHSGDNGNLSDAEGFARRLLIAHALRIAVLRDPALPTEQLCPDWPEHRARTAISSAYARLSAPAQAFSARVIQLADGSRPRLDLQEMDWRFSH